MKHRDHVIVSLSIVVAAAAMGCGTTVSGGDGGGGQSGTTNTTTTNTTSSTGTSSGTTTGTGGTGGTTTGTGGTGGTTTTGTGGTGGTTTTGTGGTGGTTTGTGGGEQPPDPGPQTAPDGNGSAVFAIRKIFFGDTNPNGSPNFANGWKQYGFDIDGDISTQASTNLCKPRNNAGTSKVYPDGNNGIDNSFGRNVLPIMLGLQADLSTQQNAALAAGEGNYLFDLVNLGAGANYGPLVSRVYQGAATASAPLWNGNDVWPIRSESLVSPPNLASAKVQTANGYLVGNTWVARLDGLMTLDLPSAGLTFALPIQNPTIAMTLDAGHQAATHGTISGVIPTDAFIAVMKKLAGSFDPIFCDPTSPTLQSIATQLGQASDILIDGSQDPTKECDGISIGLGFEAQRVKVGAVAAPVPPLPDPCAGP